MCTAAEGQGLVVPALQQGLERRRGQSAQPGRLKTDYLWKRILTRGPDRHPRELRPDRRREEDPKTGKKKRKQIFPRYHQLDVVRKLWPMCAPRRRQALPDPALGGQRQVELHRLAGAPAHRPAQRRRSRVFDSIIVVTDRRILDEQIRDTIKQFAQVGATVGHAEHSGDLRKFIEEGKKIIITTVQKFPFILDEIGDEHRAEVRHHHRRGALQPGRQDLGGA
jgi:type I restriction enzyme R subunit